MGEVSVLTSQTCYIIPPVMPSAHYVTATPITIALDTPLFLMRLLYSTSLRGDASQGPGYI